MTKVSTNDLVTQLAELSFTGCNTGVPVLITNMMDIKLQIEAEKDSIYDTDHFMTLFFNKCLTITTRCVIMSSSPPAPTTTKGP